MIASEHDDPGVVEVDDIWAAVTGRIGTTSHDLDESLWKTKELVDQVTTIGRKETP